MPVALWVIVCIALPVPCALINCYGVLLQLLGCSTLCYSHAVIAALPLIALVNGPSRLSLVVCGVLSSSMLSFAVYFNVSC